MDPSSRQSDVDYITFLSLDKWVALAHARFTPYVFPQKYKNNCFISMDPKCLAWGQPIKLCLKPKQLNMGFEIMVVVGGIKLHPQSIMFIHHEFQLLSYVCTLIQLSISICIYWYKDQVELQHMISWTFSTTCRKKKQLIILVKYFGLEMYNCYNA